MDIDCDGQHPLLNTPVKLHCVLCWLVHSCMLSSSVCLCEATLMVAVCVMDNFENSLLVANLCHKRHQLAGCCVMDNFDNSLFLAIF